MLTKGSNQMATNCPDLFMRQSQIATCFLSPEKHLLDETLKLSEHPRRKTFLSSPRSCFWPSKNTKSDEPSQIIAHYLLASCLVSRRQDKYSVETLPIVHTPCLIPLELETCNTRMFEMTCPVACALVWSGLASHALTLN